MKDALNFLSNTECLIADPNASGDIVSADLFINNTALTTLSTFFFANQTLEGKVPSGLLDKLTDWADVHYMFGYTGITSLPDGLFANNSKIENFAYVFTNCYKLKLNETIFIDPAKGITKANRFADVTPNFQRAFYYVGYSIGTSAGCAGTLPDLWNYTYGGNGSPGSTAQCFIRYRIYTNYLNIPARWY